MYEKSDKENIQNNSNKSCFGVKSIYFNVQIVYGDKKKVWWLPNWFCIKGKIDIKILRWKWKIEIRIWSNFRKRMCSLWIRKYNKNIKRLIEKGNWRITLAIKILLAYEKKIIARLVMLKD